MKRTTVVATMLALLSTACPKDTGSPNNAGTPASQPPSPGQTAQPSPSPDGGSETTPPASPAASPGSGRVATATLQERVEASSTEASPTDFRPVLLLARNPQEAERAAAQAPAGLAQRLRQWKSWTSRALVAVIGGSQPDGSYSVRITRLLSEDAGKIVTVTGRIEIRNQGSQAISVPWALVSVNAGAVVRTTKCRMVFEGQTPREYACG